MGIESQNVLRARTSFKVRTEEKPPVLLLRLAMSLHIAGYRHADFEFLKRCGGSAGEMYELFCIAAPF